MTRLRQFLIRLKLVRTRTKRGKTLQCVDCGAPIHRSDRYVILEVKHRDCRDPKGVGQLSLEGE